MSTLNNYAAINRVDNIDEVLAQKKMAGNVAGTDAVTVQKEVARTRECHYHECKFERLSSNFMEFTIDTPVSQIILNTMKLEFQLKLTKLDGSNFANTDLIYVRNNFLTDFFKYMEVFPVFGSQPATNAINKRSDNQSIERFLDMIRRGATYQETFGEDNFWVPVYSKSNLVQPRPQEYDIPVPIVPAGALSDESELTKAKIASFTTQFYGGKIVTVSIPLGLIDPLFTSNVLWPVGTGIKVNLRIQDDTNALLGVSGKHIGTSRLVKQGKFEVITGNFYPRLWLSDQVPTMMARSMQTSWLNANRSLTMVYFDEYNINSHVVPTGGTSATINLCRNIASESYAIIVAMVTESSWNGDNSWTQKNRFLHGNLLKKIEFKHLWGMNTFSQPKIFDFASSEQDKRQAYEETMAYICSSDPFGDSPVKTNMKYTDSLPNDLKKRITYKQFWTKDGGYDTIYPLFFGNMAERSTYNASDWPNIFPTFTPAVTITMESAPTPIHIAVIEIHKGSYDLTQTESGQHVARMSYLAPTQMENSLDNAVAGG